MIIRCLPAIIKKRCNYKIYKSSVYFGRAKKVFSLLQGVSANQEDNRIFYVAYVIDMGDNTLRGF